MFFNKVVSEDGNVHLDAKLLEVAFIQEGSYDYYYFIRDAMFTEEVDQVCEYYDYTFEQPKSELVYTTYQEILNNNIREKYYENDYLVTIDILGNIAIYKKVEDHHE